MSTIDWIGRTAEPPMRLALPSPYEPFDVQCKLMAEIIERYNKLTWPERRWVIDRICADHAKLSQLEQRRA